MPSFRGKVPDDQIWQLAAYVRSMSGNVPKAAAPGRNDDMHPRPAENRMPAGRARDRRHTPPWPDAAMSAAMRIRHSRRSVSRRPALAGCQGWQSALDPQGPQARAARRPVLDLHGRARHASGSSTMVALVVALMRRGPAARRPARGRIPASERRIDIVVAGLVGLDRRHGAGADRAQLSPRRRQSLPRRGRRRSRSGSPAINGGGRSATRIRDAEPQLHDRERDPHPGRRAGAAQARILRRDPLLLGPEPDGQDGPIPGRQNEIQSQADRPGVYRGQCAEFCGLQHAHMGMLVVAEPQEDFERWRDRQIAVRRPPDDPSGKRGKEVFLSKPCVMCHSVRGTPAGGRVAPDLTHVGSRRYHRGRHPADDPRQPRRLDRRPARHQAGRQHADRSKLEPDELNASPPIWRG